MNNSNSDDYIPVVPHITDKELDPFPESNKLNEENENIENVSDTTRQSDQKMLTKISNTITKIFTLKNLLTFILIIIVIIGLYYLYQYFNPPQNIPLQSPQFLTAPPIPPPFINSPIESVNNPEKTININELANMREFVKQRKNQNVKPEDNINSMEYITPMSNGMIIITEEVVMNDSNLEESKSKIEEIVETPQKLVVKPIVKQQEEDKVESVVEESVEESEDDFDPRFDISTKMMNNDSTDFKSYITAEDLVPHDSLDQDSDPVSNLMETLSEENL